MLLAPVGKVDTVEEQINNVSMEIKTLMKNEKEMLEIKNCCKRNEEYL